MVVGSDVFVVVRVLMYEGSVANESRLTGMMLDMTAVMVVKMIVFQMMGYPTSIVCRYL
jgi:hypothetical protein